MFSTSVATALVPVAVVLGIIYCRAVAPSTTKTVHPANASGAVATTVLVIGASGAIGKKLVEQLLTLNVHVIAAIRNTPLPIHLTRQYQQSGLLAQEFNVDVRDRASLFNVFQKYQRIDVVWMLAAPLSLEAAQNPNHSREVVVGGMENILSVMNECNNSSCICFSDSIGSFGREAPRLNCTAAWLTSHSTQDPGSDYGKQKRECRELMSNWVKKKPNGVRDSRFAVIPGVLHTDSTWGDGTTEYVLAAIQCAVNNVEYVCPIPRNVSLPMIMRSDLVDGLSKLTLRSRAALDEPEGGYAMASLSFTPQELFREIKMQVPTFKWSYSKGSSAARTFASLWPDTLSSMESARDLEFVSKIRNLSDIVSVIVKAWAERRGAKRVEE